MARTTIARFNGKIIGKRTAADRVYTHVVIGQRDIEAANRFAYGYEGTKTDASNFAHYRAFLDGTSQFLQPVAWRSPAEQEAYNANAIENARKHLGGAETLEAYIAVERDRMIAKFEEAAASDAFEMKALQWSMSAANAYKAVGGFQKHYINVRVIEAEELVKPAKAAKVEG